MKQGQLSQFCGITYPLDDYTFLHIVPIKARAKERNSIPMDFSTSVALTLIRDDVSTYLSREGKWSRSQFGTFHAQDPLIRTRKVWFIIFPLNRSGEFKVEEAYSINKLNIHIHSAPPPTVLINLPHLRDIKPQEIDDGEGTILKGMKLTDAHDVVKSRMERQRKNVSMALFTPFGWCVVGKPGKSNPTRQHNISCFYTLHWRKLITIQESRSRLYHRW